MIKASLTPPRAAEDPVSAPVPCFDCSSVPASIAVLFLLHPDVALLIVSSSAEPDW